MTETRIVDTRHYPAIFNVGDRVKYATQGAHGVVVESYPPSVVCVLMDDGVDLGFLHDVYLELESSLVALSRVQVS